MEPVISIVLRDDYTVTSSEFTQEEVEQMLAQFYWEATPLFEGYISVTFYMTE